MKFPKSNLESMCLVASNLYDATTTMVGLEKKVLEEINPIVNYTIDHFGDYGLYGIKGIGVGLILYLYNKNPGKFGKALLYGASTFYMALGTSNLLNILSYQ